MEEVTLEPGWLAKDIRTAHDRVREWEALNLSAAASELLQKHRDYYAAWFLVRMGARP